MTPEERQLIRVTAKMDQERQAAKSHGKTCAVSQIELLALANLAKYGLYHAMIALGAGEPGPLLDRAGELLEAIKDLDTPPVPGKTPRLITTCAAILGGDRIGQYVMED